MNQAESGVSLEDELLLPSWGAWQRGASVSNGSSALPAWVAIMIQKQGYRETYAKEYTPPITDEYAMRLDRLIAGLPEKAKRVMICIYVYKMSVRAIAKSMRRSDRAVTQDRDFAIAYLYGALRNNE